MSEQKRVFRWFWAWNDEKEERWLEEMARAGWRFVKGPIVYTFEKSAPEEVRYRLDYQPDRKNLDEYLRLCRDSGWERVNEYFGWQYLRAVSPDAPEIYTDAASRIAKYQRLLVFCVLMAGILIAGNMQTLLGNASFATRAPSFYLVTRYGVICLMVLWAYVIARLALHIRGLKKRAVPAMKA